MAILKWVLLMFSLIGPLASKAENRSEYLPLGTRLTYMVVLKSSLPASEARACLEGIYAVAMGLGENCENSLLAPLDFTVVRVTSPAAAVIKSMTCVQNVFLDQRR